MKKILLLCSVAFIFACSNENEATTTQENSTIENTTTSSKSKILIENETDEMFYQYVNSDIYIEISQLKSKFYNDLNLDESMTTFTPNEMFSWINTNLSRTNFKSVEQARNQWNHILSRKSVEIQQFKNIYEFITTSSVGEVVYYLDKWLPIGGNIIINSDCKKNYDACRNNANADYKQNLADAQNDQSSSTKTELYSCADLQHEKDIAACTRAYNACK